MKAGIAIQKYLVTKWAEALMIPFVGLSLRSEFTWVEMSSKDYLLPTERLVTIPHLVIWNLASPQ